MELAYNIKTRGRSRYINSKTHPKRKTQRSRTSSPHRRTNSAKCCSFCCPEYSRRMEAKKQIKNKLNNLDLDLELDGNFEEEIKN